MNILVKTMGGGIFSIFTVAIQQILHNVSNVKDIENIYIEIDKSRQVYSNNEIIEWVQKIENETGNPFDFVLEQKNLQPSIVLVASPLKTYDNHENLYGTEELKKLQIICSKIKIKENVLSKIKKDIDKNTLGVHVRLTDMLEHHLDKHKGGSTDEYIYHLKNITSNNNFKNIYIASDNEFSLQKIKENFDIIHNDTNNLNKTEHGGDYYNYQLDNMHREFFWVDSFVDMLSLSRCGVLLYKLSNLNNTSLFFSKTLTKFYKI